MTPACSALDRAGIVYKVHPYEHDPAAESFGLEAAEALGVDARVVFKTLMAELSTDELVVAVVPVTSMLDLKALAHAAAVKKASMADPQAAERSSGYVVGGISPFGQRTARRTFLDDSAMTHETIYVSGGRRGLDLSIRPTDAVDFLSAVVAPLQSR